MQLKIEDHKPRAVSSKPPPAAGGGVQMRISGRFKGRDISPRKVSTSSVLSTADAKGLAKVLYGIQDSCGLITGDVLRKQQMLKEIVIKRALSPPPKRLSLRWRNFQPSPSRLSTMSSA